MPPCSTLFALATQVFAQSGVGSDVIGTAGVVGFLMSGGTLVWFLYSFLPKDRARQEKREDALIAQLATKDAQIEKQGNANTAQMMALIASRDDLLREQVGLERASCEKRHEQNVMLWKEDRDVRERQFSALMAEHQQTRADSKELRHAIKNLDQTMQNWLTVARHYLKVDGLEQGGPTP